MSYKKIEDIDYLYNNIQEELDESLKHSLGVLYEEMQDSGYSDGAITSYFETVNVIELHEKLELLSENPVKNPNNWRKAWDIIRNAGRRIGGTIRSNTPLKVRVPISKANNAVKSTVKQGEEIIKNNPLKSSLAGVGGLGVASAASNSGNSNNTQNSGSTFRAPGIDKAERIRTGGNNVSNFVSGKDNKTTSSSQQKDDQPSTAEIRAKNKEDGGTGMSNISPKEGNAKINGKEINPNSGKETQVNKDAAFDAKFKEQEKTVERSNPNYGMNGKFEKGNKARAKEISPASFSTSQRQTRELLKKNADTPYPKIEKSDLNQFNRSKKYTANDGKTQVDRSTVFTKAKFDFGNIKKGQELGVMGKRQRQQYDLKAASFKEEVAIDENRMASHTAGMSDAQKDAATSSVSRSTADKMGRRSDEAAFKGRKKKTSARYSSTGGKKRKNTTGRGQPEQYRKSADSPENEGRYPYGRSKIVQGKGSMKGLTKEDFAAIMREQIGGMTKSSTNPNPNLKGDEDPLVYVKRGSKVDKNDLKNKMAKHATNHSYHSKSNNNGYKPTLMVNSYDAFDIVLGYLVESEQVDSIDEALYVMMEMDAATIQSIVRDFEILSEEAADKEKDDRLVKYGIGHDGSDKKADSGRRSGKKPKGKTNLQKEDEKKYGKGKSAVDIVRAKIEKKHGKGAIA